MREFSIDVEEKKEEKDPTPGTPNKGSLGGY
jgi:hypothetical protein